MVAEKLIESPSPIIGIRDSGVGGLTVARQVKQLLPHVQLLYFADTANMPYGDRSPEEIRHFAFSITDFLQSQGANLVIFACNTTSAYALDSARNHFDIPLIGMIVDGAHAAVCAVEKPDPIVGVLATTATVRSGIYTQQIRQLRAEATCIEMACPEFVPLVESEQIFSSSAVEACKAALDPLIKANVDVVILGCTHFPLLLPTLQKLAPKVLFIDPAYAVATQVAQLIESTFGGRLTSECSFARSDKYFASGDTKILRHWITTLMNPSNIPAIESGPIFRL